jgi:hypothetical protein
MIKMKRFFFAMLPLLVFGCLSDIEIGLPMKRYTNTKIAIAPFEFEEEAKDIKRLTTDVGIMLSLVVKENEWLFDESEKSRPVTDQMVKYKLSAKEIYETPALAAKIGTALGVKVIIVGCVSNPRIKHQYDDTQYYDMSLKGSIEGSVTTRYTIFKQWATIDVGLKAIDVQRETLVWTKDNLKGYIKYIKSFQAQTPESFKQPIDDKIVTADLLRHLTMRITHALYPDDFRDAEVPEILEKPEQDLVGAGGRPIIF